MHIVEQVVVVALKSVKNHDDAITLDVLHILVNEICQTILDHILKTQYKYSIAAAKKLEADIR